jgi:Family of unknown function (DUF5686)/CarboxypepD_reg-like domain
MRNLLLALFLAPALCFSQATLSGNLSDEKGEPLPFASVYLKGSTIGTTTNVKGEYALQLAAGTHNVVFQYIGYQAKTMTIEIGRTAQRLDVSLKQEAIQMSEFVVSSKAEDPAYPIIRKAIEKREYYRDQVPQYRCETYVKGNIAMLDAPKKIMGQDIGDLEGTLDSNRRGILYLAESRSILYFDKPDKYREEMISTKVSGNDQGFGFNRAQDMDFSPYDSYSNLGRRIVSPIAPNALGYYKYKLVGTFQDNDGRTINKIKIIPKRSEDPVYRGHIYIVDGLWNVQSTDFILLQSAIKQPGLDTLFIKQTFVPMAGTQDVWRVFSNNISFKAGALGFKMKGTFNSVLSNYNIDPKLEKQFFGKEVFVVREGANEKSREYWDSLRPIPLTSEETVDYVKKDSLQILRKSKPYRDSIDRKNNKLSVMELLTGYDYQRSYYRESFNVASPLSRIQFNTVQGLTATLDMTYSKNYDDYGMKWFYINPRIQYGFADQQFRGEVIFAKKLEGVHNTTIRASAGRWATQFNPENPISPTSNSIATLVSRKNYLKIYDRTYARIGLSRELVNGIYFSGNLEYAQRDPLVNNTDFSFKDRNNSERPAFWSNDPRNQVGNLRSFREHQAMLLNFNFRFRFGQEYMTYPGRKYSSGAKGPDLNLGFRAGLPILGSDVDFYQVRLGIEENYLPIAAIGYSEYLIRAGGFFGRKKMEFMDYQHFNGNLTLVGDPENYLNGFFKMPYYTNSTNSSFLTLSYQHHFEGAVLDWIPLVKKLGWKLVVGANYLRTGEGRSHNEFNLGIENIGVGVFRLFRVDYVLARSGNGAYQPGVVLGIGL